MTRSWLDTKRGSKLRGTRGMEKLREEAVLAIVRILNMTRWSQKELADFMEIHPQTVSNWVSGIRTPDRSRCKGIIELELTIRDMMKKSSKAEYNLLKEMENARDK